MSSGKKPQTDEDAHQDGEQALYLCSYFSTAIDGISNQHLRAILEESRLYNPAHDVTGCLLFDGASFFQILEGPKAEIDTLFKGMITRDRRHKSIISMIYTPISARLFGEWSMELMTGKNHNQLKDLHADLKARVQDDKHSNDQAAAILFIDTFIRNSDHGMRHFDI